MDRKELCKGGFCSCSFSRRFYGLDLVRRELVGVCQSTTHLQGDNWVQHTSLSPPPGGNALNVLGGEMFSRAPWDGSGEMQPPEGQMATWHLFSKGRGFTERVGLFVGGTGDDWSRLLSGEKQDWRPGGRGDTQKGSRRKLSLGHRQRRRKDSLE